MSVCGQSPLFVPTTVNAVLRNIDAVDCAATNISCTNLTVNGEPVSTSVQNMAGSTAGNTVFNGKLVANNIQSLDKLEGFNTQTFDLTVANEANINKLTAGTLAFTSATVSGNLTADNIDTTEIRANTLRADSAVIRQIDGIDMNLSAGNLANSGELTQTGAATFSTNITQSAGTSSLKAVTATSVSNSGTLTQTGAATFATNITQSAGTSSLKTVTATGLTVNGDASITGTLTPGTLSMTNLSVSGTSTLGGNITQTAGTSSLKSLTLSSGLSSLSTDTITTASLSSGQQTAWSGLFANAATNYNGFRLVFANFGCSGLFTPYIQLVKNSSAYSANYRATTQSGSNVSTSSNRITLNASTDGLDSGEKMTGMINFHKISSTSYYFMGFAESSTTVGWTIHGTVTSLTSGVDQILFGVTGGTISSGASCTVTPIL